jgi:hypothetical protein
VRKGDDLTTFIVPKVKKIRSLNLPEPHGPPQPVARQLYLLPYTLRCSCKLNDVERKLKVVKMCSAKTKFVLTSPRTKKRAPTHTHTHTPYLKLLAK